MSTSPSTVTNGQGTWASSARGRPSRNAYPSPRTPHRAGAEATLSTWVGFIGAEGCIRAVIRPYSVRSSTDDRRRTARHAASDAMTLARTRKASKNPTIGRHPDTVSEATFNRSA
jgi:hypothetical protein